MILQQSIFYFRLALGLAAVCLGIMGLWFAAGDILRPQVTYFPSSPSEAQAIYAERDRAKTAAQLGVMRGDLWTTAAITKAAGLLFEPAEDSAEQAEMTDAQTIVRHAAGLVPYDPRLWLLLAGLDLRQGFDNAKVAEAFKLSYYTGPNELALIPLRIVLATQSNAIADEELLSLLELDIQRGVIERPDFKPLIALAYRKAIPEGREVIDHVLSAIDPTFLATLSRPLNPQ